MNLVHSQVEVHSDAALSHNPNDVSGANSSRAASGEVWQRRLSAALLVLIAALFGPALTLLNPGYYWDDWLWRFTDKEQFVRLGVETGAWWSGHVSYIIYNLPNTILSMRLTSLVGWLAAGIAIMLLLIRLGVASRFEALIWMAIYSACHLGMIRFLPSVAMYAVYIAAFWIAWAVLAHHPKSKIAQLICVLLLVFAFHLTSVLMLFALMLAWLVFEQWYPRHTSFQFDRSAGWLAAVVAVKTYLIRDLPKEIFAATLAAVRANALVFAAPVIFFLLVKVPSAVLLKTSQAKVNFYSGYNFFNPVDLILSLPRALRFVPSVLSEYIAMPRSRVGMLLAVLVFAVSFVLLLLSARRAEQPKVNRSVIQMAAGCLLVFCGLFPYFVVGKPPILSDFYEARHVLVAAPGVCLTLVSLINLASSYLHRAVPNAATGLRCAAAAGIIALSSVSAVSYSLTMLVDWLGQQTLLEYFKDNREKLRAFSMIAIDDQTTGVRINNRYIWNYEYTGMLLSVIGQQTHLGLSTHEYINSPVGSPLFFDISYRQRYNAREFDFNRPHLILTLQTGEGLQKISAAKVFDVLVRHWKRQPIRYAELELIKILPSSELRQADERFAALKRIADALERYRSDRGHYPMSTSGHLPVETPFGRLASVAIGAPIKITEAAEAWHWALVPKYIKQSDLLGDCPGFFDTTCGVQYLSDGVDYKLLQRNPQDLAYVRQAYASNFDAKRNMFGLWTKGAAAW